MPIARRFARLSRTADERAGRFAVPDDGMCLSAYLVLSPSRGSGEVLVGRTDPEGPWFEVAALDAARVERIGDRWVLLATQLLLGESPDEAARRISRELLGRDDLALGAPSVFSESYGRAGGSGDPHWDLHFVYRATWSGPAPEPRRGGLWRELRFVDIARTPLAAFGRGHGDVLALAGVPPEGATGERAP